jgi:hypothetical protein
MPEPTLQVIDTNAIPLGSLEIPSLKASIPIKTCIEDPETMEATHPLLIRGITPFYLSTLSTSCTQLVS